jgi:hypothetical protein
MDLDSISLKPVLTTYTIVDVTDAPLAKVIKAV